MVGEATQNGPNHHHTPWLWDTTRRLSIVRAPKGAPQTSPKARYYRQLQHLQAINLTISKTCFARGNSTQESSPEAHWRHLYDAESRVWANKWETVGTRNIPPNSSMKGEVVWMSKNQKTSPKGGSSSPRRCRPIVAALRNARGALERGRRLRRCTSLRRCRKSARRLWRGSR